LLSYCLSSPVQCLSCQYRATGIGPPPVNNAALTMAMGRLRRPVIPALRTHSLSQSPCGGHFHVFMVSARPSLVAGHYSEGAPVSEGIPAPSAKKRRCLKASLWIQRPTTRSRARRPTRPQPRYCNRQHATTRADAPHRCLLACEALGMDHSAPRALSL